MLIYHKDIIQGTDEWHKIRTGKLTASEMKLILTPTLKPANNDKTRAHVYEIAAQRISEYTEPSYIGDDMIRGHFEEELARKKYEAERMEVVEQIGFISNGNLGYSPDGLVGDDGLIEIKSRKQKYQIEIITTQKIPDEHWMQLQTGLHITGRKWIDYISYCGGLPMCIIRVTPHEETINAIKNAITEFEQKVNGIINEYKNQLNINKNLYPTERVVQEEITV